MQPSNEDSKFEKEEAPAVTSSAAPQDSNPEPRERVAAEEPPAQGHLSEKCEGHHAKHSQLRRMFGGTGKRDGKVLSGPAEYDRAYVTQLVNYGVTDVDEVVAAVMARPDGHAVRKGKAYALDLVDEVLSAVRASAADARASEQERLAEARSYTDFSVDEVCVISSDASRYELHIEGEVLVLSAKQLCNMSEFRQAFVNVLHRVPALPPAKGKKAALWDDLVNSWLGSAEKKTLIGNATDEEVLLRVVEKAKNAIVTKETAVSLHDDVAYVENGRRYFTADGIFERVRQFERTFKHRDLARILRELGCEFDPEFLAGDRRLPVWSEKFVMAPKAGQATAPTGAPPGGAPRGAAQVPPPSDGAGQEVSS